MNYKGISGVGGKLLGFAALVTSQKNSLRQVRLRLRNIRLRTMSPDGRKGKPKRRSSSPSLAGESWCSTGAAILSPPAGSPRQGSAKNRRNREPF